MEVFIDGGSAVGCSLDLAVPVVEVCVCWCSCEPPPGPKSCTCLAKIPSSSVVLPWSVFMKAVASNASRVLAALGLGVCAP